MGLAEYLHGVSIRGGRVGSREGEEGERDVGKERYGRRRKGKAASNIGRGGGNDVRGGVGKENWAGRDV